MSAVWSDFGLGNLFIFSHGQQADIYAGLFKVIYLAPAKALVSEKVREWTARFGTTLNLKVREITGNEFGVTCLEIVKEATNNSKLLIVLY